MLKYIGGIGAAVLLAGVMFMMSGCGETSSKNTYIVGKDVAVGEIKDFYYTIDASTNPPEFQRFRFTNKEGKYFFYHEKREGNSWPLTEKHITVSGTLELNDKQWQAFFSCVEKGKVTKRADYAKSGGKGPWLFLYWTKDNNVYQVFEFADLEKKQAFEKLCVNLKALAKK